MAKLNRVCGICKKKYSYCPSCAADAKKPTWMAIFCCKNCRDLYNVLNDYEHKHLSKEEAFIKLNELDLSCKNELPGYFKIMLDEILDYEKIKENELNQESKKVFKKENIIEKDITEIEVVDNKTEKNIQTEIIESIKMVESINEVCEEVEIIKRPKTKKKVKSVE